MQQIFRLYLTKQEVQVVSNYLDSLGLTNGDRYTHFQLIFQNAKNYYDLINFCTANTKCDSGRFADVTNLGRLLRGINLNNSFEKLKALL